MSVSSWLMVSPSSSEWISCTVGLNHQDVRESRIVPLRGKLNLRMINSYHVNPLWRLSSTGFWRQAFISTLVLSLIVLITFTVLLILFRKGICEIIKENHSLIIICNKNQHVVFNFKQVSSRTVHLIKTLKRQVEFLFLFSIVCTQIVHLFLSFVSLLQQIPMNPYPRRRFPLMMPRMCLRRTVIKVPQPSFSFLFNTSSHLYSCVQNNSNLTSLTWSRSVFGRDSFLPWVNNLLDGVL